MTHADSDSDKPLPTEAEWWRAEELGRAPHEILDALVKQLEDDQEARYAAYREYARMFGADPDMFGYEDAFSTMETDLTQNELGNTIETLHAQVFKNHIVPAVSTSEADWGEWQRGLGLSRWLEGTFDVGEVYYDAVPRAGLDMLVYGTGFIKIGHSEDTDGDVQLTYTRTDTRMMLVDRLEARHGKPRNLYQKDFVDKYLLADTYGKHFKGAYVPEDMSESEAAQKRVELILDAKANDDIDMALGSRSKCDMITVREAWHLPTKKGGKNGRHVIWVKNCTLVDEVFTWDRFPFTIMRFGSRLSGFYGDSAVKRLAPTQKNFDKLNKKIDEAQDIMGIPRIILRRDAHIERSHIDDIPGGVLETDDVNGIKEWNATAVAPELYQEREAAPQKMRSLLGISDFDTQNQLPQSMREISGPALERWIDSGTARHAMTHGELERAMVDLGYLSMDYAAELEKDGKHVVVTAPGESKSTIEMLSFKDVQVDRKRMKLRIQPMSQMPQTISGKIDAFSKLRENGDIDKQTYLKMLEVPDIASVSDLLGSDEEIILKNLYYMVKKGKYIPPLQYDNLDLIVPLTTAFINKYRLRDDADMAKVGILAKYIEDAVLLKQGLDGSDPNAPPAGVMGSPMADGSMPAPGMAPPGAVPPPGAPPPQMGPPGPPPNDPSMGAPMPMAGPPGPPM